jgi:hypothetical protein
MVPLKISGFLITLTCTMALAKVPPPIPSVQDTVFTGKLTVTLSCPDTGAIIFYTTDGSIPGITGPFSPAGWKFDFDSTVTLKAIAMYKKGPGEFDSSHIIKEFENVFCCTAAFVEKCGWCGFFFRKDQTSERVRI